MLILAGVSISMLVGDNGILVQSTVAVNETRKATAREEVLVAWTSAESEHLGKWAKNTSTVKADFFTIDNLNKYLEGTGEVTELDYIENGTSTIKYLRYDENLEYTIKIHNSAISNNTGRVEVDGDGVVPIPKYDLAQKASIGDIVAYNAGNGVFDWAEYSYNSNVFSTDENGTQNNFVASEYTGKWIVSNKNEEENVVYLISTEPVGTLYLYGYKAYSNIEQADPNILENICAIYGNTNFNAQGVAPVMSDLETLNNIGYTFSRSFFVNQVVQNEGLAGGYHYCNYLIGTSTAFAKLAEVHNGNLQNAMNNRIPGGVSPIIKLEGIKTTEEKNEAGEWELYAK